MFGARVGDHHTKKMASYKIPIDESMGSGLWPMKGPGPLLIAPKARKSGANDETVGIGIIELVYATGKCFCIKIM